MKCSSWPDSPTFGCTDGGENYTSLHKTIGIADTANCEYLCQNKGEDGCCYLHDTDGCYWKASAEVATDTGSGIASKCSDTSNPCIIFFINI